MNSRSLQLTREVRFQLAAEPFVGAGPVRNSWSGWPTTELIAPFVTVHITVSGPISSTGFVANVKTLDDIVRDRCAPLLIDSLSQPGSVVVTQLFGVVSEAVPAGTVLQSLRLAVTPYLSIVTKTENPTMAILTQQFEFSAAHRLHCAELSDEENRKLFGKCNHVNGHGHNYVVDVSVDRASDDGADSFDLRTFERTVCEHVIDYLDHKHLNIDVPEFQTRNPTVENIAGVVWDRLEPVVSGLQAIRVYETPKTWADVTR